MKFEFLFQVTIEHPDLEANNDDDDDSEEGSDAMTEALYDPQAVTVPVTVCLLIIVG